PPLQRWMIICIRARTCGAHLARALSLAVRCAHICLARATRWSRRPHDLARRCERTRSAQLQIVGQALLACCHTVNTALFMPHSLHAYFILAGELSAPVFYHVRRLRDGKSYCTRLVEARQHDRAIFVAIASFHKPEASPVSHAFAAPPAPPPSALPTTRQQHEALVLDDRLPPRFHSILRQWLEEDYPLDVRYCRASDPFAPTPDTPAQLVWMRAKHPIQAGNSSADACTGTAHLDAHTAHVSSIRVPGAAAEMLTSTVIDDVAGMGWRRAVHCAVAAYASDYAVLGTAMLPHGSPNPFVSLMTSLDHALWFHAPVRADEWMLYELASPRMCSGRGFVAGHMYDTSGQLVMSAAQEGVIRFQPEFGTSPLIRVLREEDGGAGEAATAPSVPHFSRWTLIESMWDADVASGGGRHARTAYSAEAAGGDRDGGGDGSRLPAVLRQPEPTWGTARIHWHRK
ncbi:hypothetical protein EON62_04325, partial [archaeon]